MSDLINILRAVAFAVIVQLMPGSHAMAQVADPPQYSASLAGPGYPKALNNHGDAVGWVIVNSLSRAWVSVSGGGSELLPLPPGALQSRANDINDAGIVVGSAWSSGIDGPGRAIAWYPWGGNYVAADLGALPGHNQSEATAVNNVDDIVGYSLSPGWMSGPPVLFTAPEGVRNLVSSGFWAVPQDINDQRQLVGGSMRMDLDTNSVEDLGTPEGSFTSANLYGISEDGSATGYALVGTGSPNNRRIVRYTDPGGWEVLSAAGPYNAGYGINAAGDISLEFSTWCAFTGAASFVAGVQLNGLGSFCLQDLLDAESRDWSLGVVFGNAINDVGQILVVGNNVVTGESGAVLLTNITTVPPIDTDQDGVADSQDNCTHVMNSDQRDTDADGTGNLCDSDVAAPNDCYVNFLDLNVYRTNFFQSGDLDTDNNGDGQTNFVDLNIARNLFFGPPGPSANGCN